MSVKVTSNYSDEQLTSYLRQGTVWAYERIYHRYWAKLYAYAYHQIGIKEEAEQAVHDVFEQLWIRRDVVQINQLEMYLMVATKYTVNKLIRSQITFRKYQEYLIFQQIQRTGSLQNDTDEPIHFGELTRAVDQALKQLPDKTAQIFRMSRLENRSHREIAELMGLSEKAVEYHVTKSLKHLKLHLKPYTPEN
jgi:RNA polymerase sigma-70 factor (family 1)